MIILSLPEKVLIYLLEDFEIDNTTITKQVFVPTKLVVRNSVKNLKKNQ